MNHDDKTLISALIDIAAADSWTLREVYAGEDWVTAGTRIEATALLGDLDEAILRFVRDTHGSREYAAVVCVFGSGDRSTLTLASDNFSEIIARVNAVTDAEYKPATK